MLAWRYLAPLTLFILAVRRKLRRAGRYRDPGPRLPPAVTHQWNELRLAARISRARSLDSDRTRPIAPVCGAGIFLLPGRWAESQSLGDQKRRERRPSQHSCLRHSSLIWPEFWAQSPELRLKDTRYSASAPFSTRDVQSVTYRPYRSFSIKLSYGFSYRASHRYDSDLCTFSRVDSSNAKPARHGRSSNRLRRVCRHKRALQLDD